MKNIAVNLILVTCTICLMFCFYYMGQISGRDQERTQIKTQIQATQHAPGIVTIGDSTYIVRYYSLNY